MAPDGDLYCSDACYDLDNDDIPITPLARNKAGGFGRGLSWGEPQKIYLPERLR